VPTRPADVPVVVNATALDGVSQVWLTWSGGRVDQLELSWLAEASGAQRPFSASAARDAHAHGDAYDPSDVAGSA